MDKNIDSSIIRAIGLQFKLIAQLNGMDLVGSDVTLAQMRILHIVSEKRETTVSFLAKELGVNPAAITPQINTLEKANWIMRDEDRNDKRRVSITLNSIREEEFRSMKNRHDENMRLVLHDLSDEEKITLLSLLNKMELSIRHKVDKK